MHFCADCGQALDVAGGHRVGVDSCPACGSANVSATASPGTVRVAVTVPQPGLTTLLDWPSVWMSIARAHTTAAFDARRAFDVDPSRSLSEEFRCGLVAIAAAAFAVEAEQRRALEAERATSGPPPPERTWKRNAGDHLGSFWSTTARSAMRRPSLSASCSISGTGRSTRPPLANTSFRIPPGQVQGPSSSLTTRTSLWPWSTSRRRLSQRSPS